MLLIKGEPVTKGTGRFGAICKIQRFYVNVRRNMILTILLKEILKNSFLQKLEKEANRYIQQWEKEKFLLKTEDGTLIKLKKMFKIRKRRWLFKGS